MHNILLVLTLVVTCRTQVTSDTGVVFTQCQCTCPTTILSAISAANQHGKAETSEPREKDGGLKNQTVTDDNEEEAVESDEDSDESLGSGIEPEVQSDSSNIYKDPGESWKYFHVDHALTTTPTSASQQTITAPAETTALPTTNTTSPSAWNDGSLYLEEPGPKGEKGDTGLPGQDGVDGVKGDRGSPGIRGYPGVAGLKGEKGDKGAQGIRGYPGNMGPQGYRGPEGPQGEPGTEGPRGLDGPRGYTGEQGMAGQKGSKGDSGEQGLPGKPGEPGKDLINDAPQKVAFLARLQEHFGPSTITSHVVFQQVDFNLGRCYDPSSGSFLVTAEGLYVFHLQAMAMADHIAWLAIQVNGEPVAYLWASGYLSGVEQMGVSITMQQLQIGDVVNIIQKASEKPPNYLYAHYTSFSGYLLG